MKNRHLAPHRSATLGGVALSANICFPTVALAAPQPASLAPPFSTANPVGRVSRTATAGHRLGTALTEGTTNFLVNRHINKSQQTRWSRHGADLLLQIRCAGSNGKFRPGFGQLLDAYSCPETAMAACARSRGSLDGSHERRYIA